MNSQRAGLRTGAFVFGLVCLGHIWRLVAHAPVQIGAMVVPMWLSGVGAIFAGALSIWFWRLSKT